MTPITVPLLLRAQLEQGTGCSCWLKRKKENEIRRDSRLNSLATLLQMSKRPLSNLLQTSYFILEDCKLPLRDPKVSPQDLIISQNYYYAHIRYLGIIKERGVSTADLDTKTIAGIQLLHLTKITILLLM